MKAPVETKKKNKKHTQQMGHDTKMIVTEPAWKTEYGGKERRAKQGFQGEAEEQRDDFYN